MQECPAESIIYHTLPMDDIETASDYGSDFTAEEQDLLNGLLDSFGSNTSAVARNLSVPDFDVTASQEVALNDLLDSLPAPGVGDSKDIEVTDIEDYEEPKGLRLPKILGKERWAPPLKKTAALVQLPETAAAGSGNCGNTNSTSAW
jgi:hypothetical protein